MNFSFICFLVSVDSLPSQDLQLDITTADQILTVGKQFHNGFIRFLIEHKYFHEIAFSREISSILKLLLNIRILCKLLV